MINVQSKTIGLAWINSIKAVIEFGTREVYDNSELIIELVPLIVEITRPNVDDEIITKYGKPAVIEFMKKNFRELNPVLNWGYSYGERLYNIQGLNQVNNIITLLKSNPNAKSATINLLSPFNDIIHKPCLTTIDFKIRKGILLVFGYFRSQDIGTKMYADAMELYNLGKDIAMATHCNSISITHIISSAHIYSKDLEEVSKLMLIDENTLAEDFHDSSHF